MTGAVSLESSSPVERARALRRDGRTAEAERVLRGALDPADGAVLDDAADDLLAELADLHREAGSLAEEEQAQAARVAVARRRGDTEPERRIEALQDLSGVLRRRGKYAEAVPVLRELVAAQEEARGPEHPSLGLSLDLLAAALSRAHPERTREVKRLEVRAAQLRARRR